MHACAPGVRSAGLSCPAPRHYRTHANVSSLVMKITGTQGRRVLELGVLDTCAHLHVCAYARASHAVHTVQMCTHIIETDKRGKYHDYPADFRAAFSRFPLAFRLTGMLTLRISRCGSLTGRQLRWVRIGGIQAVNLYPGGMTAAKRARKKANHAKAHPDHPEHVQRVDPRHPDGSRLPVRCPVCSPKRRVK